MNDLISFLVSEEAILVYIIALIVSVIYVFYCVIKNTSHNRKKKQNTMELNKLVEEVKSADKVSGVTTPNNNVSVVKKEEKKELKESVVIENKEQLSTGTLEKEVSPIVPEVKESLEKKMVIKQEVLPISINNDDVVNSEVVKIEEPLSEIESVKEVVEQPVQVSFNETVKNVDDITNNQEVNNTLEVDVLEDDIPCIKIIEEDFIPVEQDVKPLLEDVSKEEMVSSNEEIVYTSIEPEQEEAKKQLAEITEKLENEKEEENIELTEFERMQEDTAIISLDELMKKAGELYERNEEIQYQDEGNEPISLADLEKRKNEVVAIQEDENKEIIEDIQEINTAELEQTKITTVSELKPISDDHKFKSSPVISPVYGLEQVKNQVTRNTELELENTANLEKLDAEIRKSNQFIAVLKELQKKLD